MIIVRAWPYNPVAAGRPHVDDGWLKVPVDDYDYRALAETGEDVLTLDWDTAVSREDLLAFAGHAQARPGRILTAPCRLYRRGLPARWNVSLYDRARPEGFVTAAEGTELVHATGFGMVYLPRDLLAGYVAANPGRPMTDLSFCWWHHHEAEPFLRVDWSVRPVHLHYPECEDGTFGQAADSPLAASVA